MIQKHYGFVFVAILIIATLLGLNACSSKGAKWNHNDYTVKSGDTLYSIAWRYELDPEQFSAWNGLKSWAFIKAGQRLHTRKPYNFDANQKTANTRENSSSNQSTYTQQNSSVPYSQNKKWVKVKEGDSLYKLSKRYGINIKRLAQLNQLTEPYVIQPGQTLFLKPLVSSKAPSKKSVTKNTNKTTVSGSNNKIQTSTSSAYRWPKTIKWHRPAKGKVVKKFNRKKNNAKGIDIAGKQGDAIVASAAGKVVYSGNGLISYGNLIIIKHNKTFLSAYAYNRKLLVKEGDVVKPGQKIAEMGRKDKHNTRLHFEIRKNGKPVDPLKYLSW